MGCLVPVLFDCLRAGEISVTSEAAYDNGEHLNFSDIAIDSIAAPKTLKVTIKASKTDPFHQGIDIFIERTNNELCPVAAMLAYLTKRGHKEGMLFHFKDGRLLTQERLVAKVRSVLTAVGIDYKPYSGHSFLIGAPTQAGSKGLPPATIQTMGHWQSSAYLPYMRMSRE